MKRWALGGAEPPRTVSASPESQVAAIKQARRGTFSSTRVGWSAAARAADDEVAIMQASAVAERRFLFLSWGPWFGSFFFLLMGAPLLLAPMSAASIGGKVFMFLVGCMLVGVGGYDVFVAGGGLRHFILVSPEIVWLGDRKTQATYRPEEIVSARATFYKRQLTLEIVTHAQPEPRLWSLGLFNRRERARFESSFVAILGDRASVRERMLPIGAS